MRRHIRSFLSPGCPSPLVCQPQVSELSSPPTPYPKVLPTVFPHGPAPATSVSLSRPLESARAWLLLPGAPSLPAPALRPLEALSGAGLTWALCIGRVMLCRSVPARTPCPSSARSGRSALPLTRLLFSRVFRQLPAARVLLCLEQMGPGETVQSAEDQTCHLSWAVTLTQTNQTSFILPLSCVWEMLNFFSL